jgi:phage major head subunit gpT-like protein
LYTAPVRQLAEKAVTHPVRNIANLLNLGFTTAWIDAANEFSNTHVWPGAGTWDNLDTFPLTAGNLEIAALHLMLRQGPDGEELGLMPKLLVVGPHNRANAQRILNRELVGGGNTNIHYDEMDLLVLSRLATLRPWSWYVVDDTSPPILVDVRQPPTAVSQTAEDSDEVFERERYRFKSSIEYVQLIMEPWRIQAVDWNAALTTTTA